MTSKNIRNSSYDLTIEIALVSIIICLLSSLAIAASNPLVLDGFVNDVDVVKYNGEYYMMGNWMAGEILNSQDFRHWQQRQHVFSWTNNWFTPLDPQDPDMDIHDCHLRYDNGTFHLYCQLGANITHAISDNVWDPYQEVSINAPFSGSGIGAEVFMDDDGSFHFYPTMFDNGNQIYYRPMQDLWSFVSGSDYSKVVSTSEAWEGGTPIIEGAKVFKYHDRYYMLYNAYHTATPEYSFGCVEASSPSTFSNAGKYPYSVLTRKTWPGTGEINTIGQPWLIEGLNGFERWAGYFAIHNFQFDDGMRRQSIDRAHFFDETLYIDGPTTPYATGYHPGPAQPQYRGIFNDSDGSIRTEDWTEVGSGNWFITNKQACQDRQNTFSFNTVNRDKATNYLIEANVKFGVPFADDDKAGVLAYYKDSNNWMLVGLDRSLGSWYYAKYENAVLTVVGTPWPELDFAVYHKIKVTKNGSSFDIRIDDRKPPSYTGPISTIFDGRGIPGIYTDHAQAYFDGVIYTIGWDEYNDLIDGWGDSLTSTPSVGTWTVGSSGLTQSSSNGDKVVFKGDLAGNYEFSTHMYKQGGGNSGSYGVYPVYIDSSNYMQAMIDLGSDTLTVDGLNDGTPFSQQVIVTDATDYNLRAVKLSDKVILFVNGEEKLTVDQAFGSSQVALATSSRAARFNGIMLYQTELFDEQAVVAYLPLDNNIYDMSGNYIEATAFGVNTFETDGHIDGAMIFDGNGSYIEIPRIVNYDFSLACWIKTTQSGPTTSNWWDGVGLIDSGSSGAVADFGLSIIDGRAAFGIKNYTVSSGTSIDDGQWHYVVATRKMSTHRIELYVDGFLEASTTALMLDDKPLAASDTITVGRNQTNGRKFTGMMDDVKIHERVLTATEIMNNLVKNPICTTKPLSDLNDDCAVTIEDLLIMSEHWLNSGF